MARIVRPRGLSEESPARVLHLWKRLIVSVQRKNTSIRRDAVDGPRTGFEGGYLVDTSGVLIDKLVTTAMPGGAHFWHRLLAVLHLRPVVRASRLRCARCL